MRCSIKNTALPYRGEPTRPAYQKNVIGDVSKYLRVELPCEYDPKPLPKPEPKPKKKQAPPPKKERKKAPSVWDNPEKVKALINAYDDGLGYAEIAEMLGVSCSTVAKECMDLIADGFIEPRKRQWSKRELDLLITMYTEGRTGKEMCAELGRTRGTIDRMISQLRGEGRICKRKKSGKE